MRGKVIGRDMGTISKWEVSGKTTCLDGAGWELTFIRGQVVIQ